MPTTVVHSIGTSSRDYSTVNAWVAASPADLTVVDEIWRGECYNDSEFGPNFTISGITTDTTRYVELTTATGQSFQDNAGVRTNALTYDQSKGVGFKHTPGDYSNAYLATMDNIHISKIQFTTLGVLTCLSVGTSLSTSASVLKDCIITNTHGSSTGGVLSIGGGTFINLFMLGYTNNNSSGGISEGGYAHGLATCIGCCVVKPSNVTAAGTAYQGSHYQSMVMESCASFGYSTATSLVSSSSQNNATDQASMTGTGNQTSVTYNATTPFTQADSTGSIDFRPVAGTALAGNGFLDSTNAPNDITGTSRPGSPTIGVWQLVSSDTLLGQAVF